MIWSWCFFVFFLMCIFLDWSAVWWKGYSSLTQSIFELNYGEKWIRSNRFDYIITVEVSRNVFQEIFIFFILFIFAALEYHNLNTSIATRDFWVITGRSITVLSHDLSTRWTQVSRRWKKLSTKRICYSKECSTKKKKQQLWEGRGR